jgi:hypothetical protein
LKSSGCISILEGNCERTTYVLRPALNNRLFGGRL